MKNRKGFTLIELLAVIAIMAIIALVATPVITNIIEDAKENSAINSGYSIIKAAELDFASEKKALPVVYTHTSGLKFKGKKPTSFVVNLNAEADVNLSAWFDGFCVVKGYSDDSVTVDKTKTTENACTGFGTTPTPTPTATPTPNTTCSLSSVNIQGQGPGAEELTSGIVFTNSSVFNTSSPSGEISESLMLEFNGNFVAGKSNTIYFLGASGYSVYPTVTTATIADGTVINVTTSASGQQSGYITFVPPTTTSKITYELSFIGSGGSIGSNLLTFQLSCD